MIFEKCPKSEVGRASTESSPVFFQTTESQPGSEYQK